MTDSTARNGLTDPPGEGQPDGVAVQQRAKQRSMIPVMLSISRKTSRTVMRKNKGA